MFREQAQAQARHRIKSETTQKAGKAKSLRDQKAKVNVMGMLGVMHQKFGTMGGANAVVHSMFEVVEGFGDISTGDARKAADNPQGDPGRGKILLARVYAAGQSYGCAGG